jgi:hypothetical protein
LAIPAAALSVALVRTRSSLIPLTERRALLLRSAVPATPTERESDEAAEKSPDADRKANSCEGMSPDLQRRLGAAVFDRLTPGHHSPSDVPDVRFKCY